MGQYYFRRILYIFPTMFMVVLVTFIIMHAAPGGPWDIDPGSRTSDPRVQERLNKAFGLDKPLFFNPEAAQKATSDGQGLDAAAQGFFEHLLADAFSLLANIGDDGYHFQ